MKWAGDPNAFPRMPAESWEGQPVEAWRYVERICRAFWPGRVRQELRIEPPTPVEPGWLTREHGQRLEAVDVPVGRLFTAWTIEEARLA